MDGTRRIRADVGEGRREGSRGTYDFSRLEANGSAVLFLSNFWPLSSCFLANDFSDPNESCNCPTSKRKGRKKREGKIRIRTRVNDSS